MWLIGIFSASVKGGGGPSANGTASFAPRMIVAFEHRVRHSHREHRCPRGGRRYLACGPGAATPYRCPLRSSPKTYSRRGIRHCDGTMPGPPLLDIAHLDAIRYPIAWTPTSTPAHRPTTNGQSVGPRHMALIAADHSVGVDVTADELVYSPPLPRLASIHVTVTIDHRVAVCVGYLGAQAFSGLTPNGPYMSARPGPSARQMVLASAILS